MPSVEESHIHLDFEVGCQSIFAVNDFVTENVLTSIQPMLFLASSKPMEKQASTLLVAFYTSCPCLIVIVRDNKGCQ